MDKFIVHAPCGNEPPLLTLFEGNEGQTITLTPRQFGIFAALALQCKNQKVISDEQWEEFLGEVSSPSDQLRPAE